MIEIYERGIELRKKVVILMGNKARKVSGLGADSDHIFYLGRGDFIDALGPRTLSLELDNNSFSITRASARDASNRAHDIITLKSHIKRNNSVSDTPRLTHQVNYAGVGTPKGLAIESEDTATFLRLFKTDLDLAEKIISQPGLLTSPRDEVA